MASFAALSRFHQLDITKVVGMPEFSDNAQVHCLFLGRWHLLLYRKGHHCTHMKEMQSRITN